MENHYVIGRDGTSDSVVTDGQLVKHTLVVGPEETGATNIAAALALTHLKKDRSLCAFNSGSGLNKLILDELGRQRNKNTFLLDTRKAESVPEIEVMARLVDTDPEEVNELGRILYDACERESLECFFNFDVEDTGDLEVLFEEFTSELGELNPLCLALRSSGRNVSLRRMIKDRKNFLSTVFSEKGSTMLGSLLLHEVLKSAEKTKSKDPYIILVDSILKYVGSDSFDYMELYTDNNVGVVVSTTYQELSWYERNCREAYLRMLAFGNIFAIPAGGYERTNVARDVYARVNAAVFV